MTKEEIVDAKHDMAELVDLARGREIHSGSDLNEEPMEGNDVDNQPTPIVKLPRAREYANYYQICSGASFRVFSCRCDEHAIFFE